MRFKRAVIEVNGSCNYSCSMCPQSKGRHSDFLGAMGRETFKDILHQANPEIVNLEGSGEATMLSDLPWYIETAKKHGAKVYIFSNGLKMRGQFMRDCVDAGLDFFRFSIIGYDPETYRQWMNSSNFHWVLENMHQMREYSKHTFVASYHLILDNSKKEYEKQKYLDLVGDGHCEIWAMHNWSGTYSPPEARTGALSSCNRPFADDIVIRANGAVHPCCQVLGRDEEAVLGNVKQQSVENIFFGHEYSELRKAHKKQKISRLLQKL